MCIRDRYVRQAIPNTPLRAEIVSAFQAGTVFIEFVNAQKVTRVRPKVRFAGNTPDVICV